MTEPNKPSDIDSFERYLKQFTPTPPTIELGCSIPPASKHICSERSEKSRLPTRTWLWVAASWIAGLIMGGSAVMATRTEQESGTAIAGTKPEISIDDQRTADRTVVAFANAPPSPFSPSPKNPISVLQSNFLMSHRTSEEQSILSARGYVARTGQRPPLITFKSKIPKSLDVESIFTGESLNRADLMRELLTNPTIQHSLLEG